MTDAHFSELSALVDGELTDYQGLALYTALGRDPRLRAAWERYHLIGQALRGESVNPAVRGLAEAVRRCTEPARPARGPLSLPSAPRFWRAPFAGAALAAGAAFLAVFAVPGRHQVAAPVRPAVPAQAGAARASVPALRRWEIDRPELATILDRLLVNHQVAAPAARARGLLTYVGLVGHEAPR